MNYNFKNDEILVNDILAESLNNYVNKDSILKASMIYSLLDGGKRVRPILFKLVLDAYNVDYLPYKNIMAAIEMIHTYSLVHDDLPAMDNDLLRRGKPTTHIRFDEATAILCGDALLNDSFTILSDTNIDAQLKIKMINILASKSGSNGMIYGQILDMNQTKNSVDAILETYYHKTCNLIQASLMLAALATNKDIKKFEEIGEYLGIAFQIQDDILEYTKTTEQIGKSSNSDIDNNKQTIVSMIGLDKANQLVNEYFYKINMLIEELKLAGSKFEEYIEVIFQRQY